MTIRELITIGEEKLKSAGIDLAALAHKSRKI
jgi:hypothetical protein